MKRAHLTISRPTCSDGSRYISIEIGDRDSSLTVIDIHISLEDFAMALTGLAHVPAEVEHWIGSNAGKVGRFAHTRNVALPGRAPWNAKDRGRTWVLDHPLVQEAIAAGWELWDDGTRSQQNDRGHHHIHLRRYEDHPQERAKGARP